MRAGTRTIRIQSRTVNSAAFPKANWGWGMVYAPTTTTDNVN